MKKDMCECSGCRKTATVKIGHGHMICEDCAKALRRLKKAGKKPRYFFKEKLLGHLGDPKDHFDICIDIPVKIH
jgi:hypothetical protein